MLENIDVFDAARDGAALFRCPVVCVTKRGTVLCLGDRRQTHTDWGTIDLVLKRSTDGGRTFGEAQILSEVEAAIERDPFQEQYGHARVSGRTTSNGILIADQSGAVHFIFMVEYLRAFYRRSEDDGVTWSAPRDITAAFEPLREQYPWRVIATGPSHGIQLENGRLLIPAWASRGGAGPSGDHRPSVVFPVFSDDGGEIWQTGEIVAREEDLLNPSETTCAQLPGHPSGAGRVLFNIRSESLEHRRAFSYSPDGATNWTKPEFQPELFEPVCQAGFVRDCADLIFSNPNPDPNGPQDPVVHFHKRENLVVKLSRDGGATWPVARVLDPGAAGYSDLGVLPDGTILCFYERATNPEKPWHMDVHTLARFDRAWLLGND